MVLTVIENKDFAMKLSPSLYATLIRVPLFLGMSQNDLLEVAAKTRFSFQKSEPKSRIQRIGQRCDQLTLLISGTAAITKWANGKEYSVTEDITGPYLIEPERLFGFDNYCAKTVTAITLCGIMTLDKSEVERLIDNFAVFRLNLLNLISTNMQRETMWKWHAEPSGLKERLIKFFYSRCVIPAGTKHFNIKMTQLAKEMNVSRRAVSATLNLMQAEGLVVLRRSCIDIPALEALI